MSDWPPKIESKILDFIPDKWKLIITAVTALINYTYLIAKAEWTWRQEWFAIICAPFALWMFHSFVLTLILAVVYALYEYIKGWKEILSEKKQEKDKR